MNDTGNRGRSYENQRGPDSDTRFTDEQAPPRGWQAFANNPGWPLTGQEFLRLSATANVGGVTVTISARVRAQDGEITRHTRSFIPAASRVIQTLDINIGDGALIGVVVRASGGLSSNNAVYVNVDLVIGQSGEQQHLVGLAQGYITSMAPLFAPGCPNWAPIEGAGCLRSITGTTPAAGANINEVVPAGARWSLIGFRCQFVTSAAAGNRIVSLFLDDGSNPAMVLAGPPANPGPSQTFVYFWSPGLNSLAPATNANQSAWAINNYMVAGYRLRTQTAALDVADQFSQVQYLVREWLDV